MKLLRQFPENSIDLVVTSPPYNIGKEYESVLRLNDYVEWCSSWLQLLHSATSTNGTMWLNLGYLEVPEKAKALPIPYLLWNHIPFYIQQEIVWNYSAGVACKNRFSPRNEKMLWCTKSPENYLFNLDDVRDPNVKYPLQRKNGKLRCNPNGKNPSDVWEISKVTSGENRSSKERTSHPAQYPEELVARCIKASSNRDSIVLDPFLGSGTTLGVAYSLKRPAIGIEIRKDYADIAVQRLLALKRSHAEFLPFATAS